MSYELSCTPRQAVPPTFRADAVAFLKALHPAFSGFDAGPDPLADLDDPLFSDLVATTAQVVYEGKELALELRISDERAEVSIGMGALGDEARVQLERSLAYIFAFARRFDLRVRDPQLGAELREAELASLLPKMLAFFDGILDLD